MIRCPKCNGNGRRYIGDSAEPRVPNYATCKPCEGTGYVSKPVADLAPSQLDSRKADLESTK